MHFQHLYLRQTSLWGSVSKYDQVALVDLWEVAVVVEGLVVLKVKVVEEGHVVAEEDGLVRGRNSRP